MKQRPVDHEFVEFIPNELDEKKLFISIPFATVVHLCLCGCGERVVTPLSPTDWRLVFDGETVSLSPSIGNWSFDCQSHYWVENSRVIWSRQWSRDKIEAGRARNQQRLNKFAGDAVDLTPKPDEKKDRESPCGWLRRLNPLLAVRRSE